MNGNERALIILIFSSRNLFKNIYVKNSFYGNLLFTNTSETIWDATILFQSKISTTSFLKKNVLNLKKEKKHFFPYEKLN